MRTTTFSLSLISGLAALALAACSGEGGDPSPTDVPQGTASAALEAAPQRTNGGGHHDPAKFIQRFDKNGDGKLEVGELPDRMQAFMGKADANGDGVLTSDELTAAREAFHAKFAGKSLDPATVLKNLDKNGDGKLEADEVPPHMQKFMSKVDTDGDGALSLDEMTAARDNFIKARFAKGDKNGDGSLTEDEVGERKWARIGVADSDNSGSVTLPEIEAAIAAGKLHFRHGHGHRFHGGADGSPAPAPSSTKS